MTSQELKYNLLNDNRISFTSYNRELLIKLEDLLISNGWKWRGHNANIRLIETSINTIVVLHSNYEIDEPKILSYDSCLSDYRYVFDVNEYTFNDIKSYFNPVPNYKPKKFLREI